MSAEENRYWNVGEEFLQSLADRISEDCREASQQAVIESWEDDENMLAAQEDEDGNISLFLLNPRPCEDLFPDGAELKTNPFNVMESLKSYVMLPLFDLDWLPEGKAHPEDKDESFRRISQLRSLALKISVLSNNLEAIISDIPIRDNSTLSASPSEPDEQTRQPID